MEIYTTNDALNILYRCGIRSSAALKDYLHRGHFQISERTLRDKMKILEKDGYVSDKRKGASGRIPSLTDEDKESILNLLDRKPELNAKEIKSTLELTCSTKPIREFLKDSGFKFMRIIKKPYLTQEHMEKRLSFAQKHLHEQWNKTFFLDETSFRIGSSPKSCYQKKDSRVQVGTFKHPFKINIIAMISCRGASRLILFKQNLKAEIFKRHLKALIEDGDHLYPRPENKQTKYRVAMDNDTAHTANLLKKFIAETKLNVLKEWPASSPDLNPVENVWGLMEKNLQKLHTKNEYQFKKNLRSIWISLTSKEKLNSLISSMPQRLTNVILNNGGITKY